MLNNYYQNVKNVYKPLLYLIFVAFSWPQFIFQMKIEALQFTLVIIIVTIMHKYSYNRQILV